jgi:hypothetical protein
MSTKHWFSTTGFTSSSPGLEHDVMVDLLWKPGRFRQALHLVHRIPAVHYPTLKNEMNKETPQRRGKKDGKVRQITYLNLS